MTDPFHSICDIVLGTEAGYTANPHDPGNWTGGAVLSGDCKGTKYGISAAAYPHLDIANLTIDAARDIYRRDYWDVVGCDSLPPAVALVVFDGAVNSGVGTSARWLQAAVGAEADGNVGNVTLAAVRATIAKTGGAMLCAELMAQRIVYDASLPTFKTFGLGWARRVCRLPIQALTLSA
jgi:lysozyme family protein